MYDYANNCIPIVRGVSNIKLISDNEVWSIVQEKRSDGGKHWTFLGCYLGVNQFVLTERVRHVLKEILSASNLPDVEKITEALKKAGWTGEDETGKKVGLPRMFFEVQFCRHDDQRVFGNIDVAVHATHEEVSKALKHLFANYSCHDHMVWAEITLPLPLSATPIDKNYYTIDFKI